MCSSSYTHLEQPARRAPRFVRVVTVKQDVATGHWLQGVLAAPAHGAVREAHAPLRDRVAGRDLCDIDEAPVHLHDAVRVDLLQLSMWHAQTAGVSVSSSHGKGRARRRVVCTSVPVPKCSMLFFSVHVSRVWMSPHTKGCPASTPQRTRSGCFAHGGALFHPVGFQPPCQSTPLASSARGAATWLGPSVCSLYRSCMFQAADQTHGMAIEGRARDEPTDISEHAGMAAA